MEVSMRAILIMLIGISLGVKLLELLFYNAPVEKPQTKDPAIFPGDPDSENLYRI